MLTPLIRKLEHFLTLPEQDKSWLNELASRRDEFPAHADIIREGEVPAGVFVVIAGHACRYKILPNGARQVLDFMFPGDMNELHSLLLSATDHGVHTLGPTIVAWIDRHRLIQEITDYPHVSIALWWSSLQRGAILRERITAIGRRDAYARVAHLLCEIFERLRLVGETADHNYQLPMTQAELGDALGISEVYATLNVAGVTDIETAAQAASALRPLAGDFAFMVFALGILGVGLIGVPVLAGSGAYALCEAMGWRWGLERRATDARGFYGIIAVSVLAGLAIQYSPISPMKALFWSAVINGVVAVPLMVVIILLVSNKSVMGPFTAGRSIIILGWIATGVMGAAAVRMVIPG